MCCPPVLPTCVLPTCALPHVYRWHVRDPLVYRHMCTAHMCTAGARREPGAAPWDEAQHVDRFQLQAVATVRPQGSHAGFFLRLPYRAYSLGLA